MLSEQDFRLKADQALEETQRALLPLADEKGFEVELQNGVLQVVFALAKGFVGHLFFFKRG